VVSRGTLAAAMRRDRKRLYARYDAGEFATEAESMRREHPTLTEGEVRREIVEQQLERRWPPF